jgi:hypothetical protein
MSKKDKIQWWSDKASLNEIYQTTGIEFAFLSAPKDGNKQCHPWVKCRDFLHDALRSTVNEDSCGIFGFKYNYAKNPHLDLSRTRMLVRKNFVPKGKETVVSFHQKMLSAKRILNHYEKLVGTTLTRLTRTTDDKGGTVWVFTGPSFWQRAPYLVSMYTFIIRLGDKDIKFKDSAGLLESFKKLKTREGTDNDQKYLCDNFDKMHLVISNWNELFYEDKKIKESLFDKEIPLGRYHNNAGINSLCRFASPVPELNVRMKKICGVKDDKTKK